MSTNQLTKLKDAGFTLDQIIAIGEIFDPERPKAEKPDDPDKPSKSALKAAEESRKAYELGRKAEQEEQRRKEMGPMIRDMQFKRRCEDFRKTQQDSWDIENL